MGNELTWVTFLSLAADFAMIIVTIVYVVFTWHLVKITKQSFQCQLVPLIGIEIQKIVVGPPFGPKRRQMSVALSLSNVGNAPAINVLIDSEFDFRYSMISGSSTIPQRFEPMAVAFIPQGGTKSGPQVDQSYGNAFVSSLLDEAREAHRLNAHRIATNPSQEPYKMSRLKVFAYYRNAVGQYFKSCYSCEVGIFNSKDIEKDKFDLSIIYVPRPEFYAIPIQESEMLKELAERNSRRELCGW